MVSTDYFQAIIESSDDAIIGKNLQGLVTSWNPGATNVFGYAAEEILGRSILCLFPQDRLAEEAVILNQIAQGQKVDHFETVRLHKDGRALHVSVTISPIRDLNGQIVGASKVARDISERRRADELSRRLSGIVNSSNDAIIAKTLTGIVTNWNNSATRIFGWAADEIVGRSIEVLVPKERRDEERRILDKIKLGESYEHYKTQRLTKDGRLIWISVSISPIHDRSGLVIGASKIARDITKLVQIEEQLLLTSSVFTHTTEAVVITDKFGYFIQVNDAFCRITGYGRDEVIGRNFEIFKSGRQGPEVLAAMASSLKEDGVCKGEIWSRKKTGEAFAGLLAINAVLDPDGIASKYIGIFADITALRTHQDELERLAHFDVLTGLPNRLLLSDRLDQALAQARRTNQSIAVAYLDLDGFKEVNDRYGHDFGDDLLVAIAARMQVSFRETDTLARMGGDEFVAVYTNTSQSENCPELLNRLLAACSEPLVIEGVVVQVSASIGVTIFPDDDSDADQLLRHADQAMYVAKQTGKNRFALFDAPKDLELKSRTEKIRRIGEGLIHDEFVLHYQPKVNMRTGEMVGAEALIRWNHPEFGLLGPAAFLPLIQDHQLIHALGEWVTESALLQLQNWKRDGHHIPLSINISAREFRAPNFVAHLGAQLAIHPLVEPQDLELELLETGEIEDIETVASCMSACRQLGVSIAIDDFGTGYSSLLYLKRLPTDVLKIDQNFVRDMLEDGEDLAIVKGVIGLAAAFNRAVVAEGVETLSLGSALLELGCVIGQGYGIARPMPADDLVHWKKDWQLPNVWQGAKV